MVKIFPLTHPPPRLNVNLLSRFHPDYHHRCSVHLGIDVQLGSNGGNITFVINTQRRPYFTVGYFSYLGYRLFGNIVLSYRQSAQAQAAQLHIDIAYRRYHGQVRPIFFQLVHHSCFSGTGNGKYTDYCHRADYYTDNSKQHRPFPAYHISKNHLI